MRFIGASFPRRENRIPKRESRIGDGKSHLSFRDEFFPAKNDPLELAGVRAQPENSRLGAQNITGARAGIHPRRGNMKDHRDLPGCFGPLQYKNRAQLSRHFQENGTWHDWLAGKVAWLIEFISGERFDSGNSRGGNKFGDAVDEQKWIAVWQNAANIRENRWGLNHGLWSW